jgi:hypothetical protein
MQLFPVLGILLHTDWYLTLETARKQDECLYPFPPILLGPLDLLAVTLPAES